jgi:ADP-ribosylglycohydrolase
MINQLFSQAEKRPSKTGGGWLGHEALAIALCAARNSLDNPIKAVKIAVNHSGDSDSTGSICGAIMGALFGAKAFEDELRSTAVNLERKEELAVLGEKLANLALKEKGN